VADHRVPEEALIIIITTTTTVIVIDPTISHMSRIVASSVVKLFGKSSGTTVTSFCFGFGSCGLQLGPYFTPFTTSMVLNEVFIMLSTWHIQLVGVGATQSETT